MATDHQTVHRLLTAPLPVSGDVIALRPVWQKAFDNARLQLSKLLGRPVELKSLLLSRTVASELRGQWKAPFALLDYSIEEELDTFLLLSAETMQRISHDMLRAYTDAETEDGGKSNPLDTALAKQFIRPLLGAISELPELAFVRSDDASLLDDWPLALRPNQTQLFGLTIGLSVGGTDDLHVNLYLPYDDAPRYTHPTLLPEPKPEVVAEASQAEIEVEIELTKVQAPLSSLLQLRAGTVFNAGQASLEQIQLIVSDSNGRRAFGAAEHGQHHGHQAVRLTSIFSSV